MPLLPDWKCVDQIVWCNPLIYWQRGKQVGWSWAACSRRRNHRLSRQLGQEVVGQLALPAACTCPRYRGCATLTPTTVARPSFPWALPYLTIYLSAYCKSEIPTYQRIYLLTFVTATTFRSTTSYQGDGAEEKGGCVQHHISSQPCNRRCRRLIWSLMLKHVRDG